MAKKEISKEELFQTVPVLPEGFEEWCHSYLPEIPIYYQRKGKKAECICGKCGKKFEVNEQPTRNEKTKCPLCGNKGFYEWKKVIRSRTYERSFYLVQCTKDDKLLVRYFEIYQRYEQGTKAKIELIEYKRIFLFLGDVYYFNNEFHWSSKGWKQYWERNKGHVPMRDGEIWRGYREEISKSCLQYCDLEGIGELTGRAKLNILIAFANNPAIEMYFKAGMEKLLNHLIWKEGKTKWINRRGKNLKQQLRIKDKSRINRFVASRGDINLLEILLMEEKQGYDFTIEQEEFLLQLKGYYQMDKKVRYLLQYMTLQQLINRVEKYRNKHTYYSKNEVIGSYYDYLQMRQELGYDMTNQVYLYPKDLKAKHDEMVKERNARRDELHIVKKLKEFPNIAKRYEKLQKKYGYSKDGYVIRPAKDAGEIIMEGRLLHHCVGGDNYLRKHDMGETTILFLRKQSKPNKPYYTIEIRDKEIVQWYGIRDTKPDKEKIGHLLEQYVKELKKGKRKPKVDDKKLLQAAG